MSDKIDIEAIRKRAEVGYRSFAAMQIGTDLRNLLSHIAALEVAHEAELLEVINMALDEFIENEGHVTALQILADYRAQKEMK